MNRKWYVLQVRPNCEMKVASQLREMGVEEYLPKRFESAANRKRIGEGTPLFPGYVFSSLDLEAGPRLYKISSLIRILGFGGRPTPIDNDAIEAIRAIVVSRLPAQSLPHFASAEKVVLTDGPLRGVRGSFVDAEGVGRFVVSIPLLSRSLSVVVPLAWVARDPFLSNITDDSFSTV